MRFLILLSVLGLMIGCVSQKWDEKPYYIEEIGGFYIFKNKNKLIGFGKKYDYLFDIDDELINILNLSNTINLTAYFSIFKVELSGVISGRLILYKKLNETTKDEVDKLKNFNFSVSERKTFIRYKVDLLGKITKLDKSLQQLVSFDKPYTVRVIIPGDSLLDKTRGLISSPIITVSNTLFEITFGSLFEVLNQKKHK